MTVGDLVRWTHPDYPAVGIIIDIWRDEAHICWCEDDDTDGLYPLDHRYLEPVDLNESR